jgi:hypothetical protein
MPRIQMSRYTLTVVRMKPSQMIDVDVGKVNVDVDVDVGKEAADYFDRALLLGMNTLRTKSC